MILTATVIIVTLNRPDHLRRCLACLYAQSRIPEQIIVVDGSSDDRTRLVALEFPQVLYLRNERGLGQTALSRNIGLGAAVGEVIAYLDDDAFAHPDWLEHLLEGYARPEIGGVGGRALNALPGEEAIGVDEIGRIFPDGHLTAYFGADPGRSIEVDHLLGASMSFRRDVLATLGGFRTDFTDRSCIREETDFCLRVRRLGYTLVFNPASKVDHLGAPQTRGRRFDVRYTYFEQRNHVTMLIRNYGMGDKRTRRYLRTSISGAGFEFARRLGGATARLGARIGGTAVGAWRGARIAAAEGHDPIRRDSDAELLRDSLRSVAVRESDVEAGSPSSH